MIYYTYPGFRNKALTISYDDGLWSDVHLLEILNRYGIRGTFNLNSGCMTEERRIGKEKIPALYKGHEIATHGVKHLTLARCPMTDVVKEILEDRQALEGLTGEIVCVPCLSQWLLQPGDKDVIAIPWDSLCQNSNRHRIVYTPAGLL